MIYKRDERVNYKNIAHQFVKKYQGFYEGKYIDEEVTQAYWHGLDLNRKRLEKLGVDLEIKMVEQGVDGPNDTMISRNTEQIQEQQHKTTIVRTPVSIRRRYYKHGKKLAEKIDYTAESICAILEKNGIKKREVVCPSCGAIGSWESLYDGCDYCGKQFQVDAEERKVSAFHVFHDSAAGAVAEGKRNTKLLLIWVILMIACMIVRSNFLLKDTMVIKILLSKIAFVVGMFAGVNGLFLLMAMIWNYKNKRVRMEQTPELEQLRKYCKDFHFGKFVEDLEYKLKTIYFAEKQEDISLFAKDDVMKKHVLYDNVLDSELRSCRIIGYEQDDRYHFIEVETIQVLTLLQGKRIVEKEERLQLKFRKSRAAHASESLVSYSCGGCGSSVNLLNGGVCDYCGQQLNLEEYDWLLVGYKSMGIKRNDAVRFYTRLLAGLFCAVILLANRSELHIATVAAKCCFEDMTTSVYVYKDEMIPSLENYGYAIACDEIKEEENKIEYRYSFVDGRSHVMSDYPLHLVEDCEFVMMQQSENMVVLQRSKEFAKGSIYVVISDLGANGYGVAIMEAE